MAGASLLTLLDDISVLMDDVSVMTKVAAKKTAGLVGDDLALNAEQVTGVKPNRHLGSGQRLCREQSDFSTSGTIDQLFYTVVDYSAIDDRRVIPEL